MDSETDLTIEEAREILTTPGYDAYGTLRIYAEHAPESIYAGQIAAIKSEYNLDNGNYSRIWYKTNNGFVPIRRA